MPVCMLAEWNEYLNYELSVFAKAILGAVPAAGALQSSGANAGQVKLTEPEQICSFLNAIAEGNK